MTNAKSPWYTESITAPSLDHVPVTPTPRKYVVRGVGVTGDYRSSGHRPHHAVSVRGRCDRSARRILVALLPSVRALIAHWRWLIVLAAAAYIAAIIFTAPPH